MTTQPVALITGSGKRRIGSHVAEALAARGYAMALHYRSSGQDAHARVDALRASGATAEAWPADLANADEVARLVDDVLARFGRIDVLVNAAAIWRPKPLEDVTAEDVREHFTINSLATFLLGQRVGLAMCRQESGGAIVNIGDWATRRPYLNYAAYFASKGAIPTLTRALAVELAHRNPRVRVNAVLPGPVMLPPDLPPAERQQSIDGTLLRREGKPENVVQAVLYLVENDFVTGDCVTVDGGRSLV
ncbi:MAG: SDR family oxidoreductase [Planctomycetes bacterium]|nr:SDR family oxidoreductase [Planctomycetota bacterium]